MKKEIKIVAIVLVALIVFLGGFGLGAKQGINITISGDLALSGGAANVGATQAPATQPTQAPATQPTQAPTQAPTDAPSGGDDTTAPTQAPSGDAKIPSTKAEIAEAYNKAINGTKNYTGNVSVHKKSVIAIQVTDAPGGAVVLKIVQPIVDKFTGTTESDYSYTNGADAEGGLLAKRVTPGDREAKLTEAGIANATAVADGDGYKMTITLVAEKSTYDGTNTVNPVNHESIMDPLNLATLDVNPIVITAADMNYPGATVEVKVDGQGRMTYHSIKMPLDGSGTGSVKFPPLDATIGLAGSLDDEFTYTYA